MAKLTEKYETIIILNTKQTEEELKGLVEKFTGLISKFGTLETVEEWGKRRLAYAINYETEGYYVLFNFTSASAFPAELDRVLKITDGVLRSLITLRAAD